jgi:6,7-dimethyl-8-ribityllumazine synthase
VRQRSAPSRTSPIEGILDGRDLGFALVVSRFNDFVTSRLLAGAQDCLTRHGVDPARIAVVRVPGSWEIPLAASVLARSGRHDGIVALGVLVRGETPHFDVLAGEVARGLSRVTMDTGVPVGFGVLTTESVDQAIERAGAKSGNKGWDAALSALEMASLLRGLA